MEMSEKSFESAVHVLEGEFINTQSERKKYSQLDILTEEKDQFISRTFLYYVRIRGFRIYPANERYSRTWNSKI